MRAIGFGLAGLAAALIALSPADLQAQGRGKARGHDKHDREGPPGQVRKQDDDGRRLGPVIVLDDDDRGGGVVIRGDRDDRRGRIVIRDDRDDRRIGRDRDGRIVLRDEDGRIIVIGRGGIDERFRVSRGGGIRDRGSQGIEFRLQRECCCGLAVPAHRAHLRSRARARRAEAAAARRLVAGGTRRRPTTGAM